MRMRWERDEDEREKGEGMRGQRDEDEMGKG